MKNLMLLILSGLFTASVSAGVIYSNDFESGNTAGWNGGSIISGAFQQNSKDDDINFKLNDSEINSAFNIAFDTVAIGTWDHRGRFEDYFIVIDRIRGAKNERLFRGNLDRGVNSFSFSDVAAFRDDRLRIRFRSNVTGSDELFAIDNVVVSAVPEPGTLVLLGMGMLGLCLSRRRFS